MKRPTNSKVGYRFGATPYPLPVRNPDGSWFGWKHYLSRMMNLLYLDLSEPMLAPPLGNSASGILKTLAILPFTKPIQIAKSKSSELRLKVHHPLVGRFLNISLTFKSIRSLFHQKSKDVPKARSGLTAPNFLMNHSSHLMPVCGLPLNKLSVGLNRRMLYDLLLQRFEQYIWRPENGVDFSNGVPHILHIIKGFYPIERQITNA